MRNYPSQIDVTFFNLRDPLGTVAFLNLRETPTMTETLTLVHERVADIPLLIGLAQKLNLPAVLDRHLGGHHLHRGLSNGWLATVWIAYILSEGDHRPSATTFRSVESRYGGKCHQIPISKEMDMLG